MSTSCISMYYTISIGVYGVCDHNSDGMILCIIVAYFGGVLVVHSGNIGWARLTFAVMCGGGGMKDW